MIEKDKIYNFIINEKREINEYDIKNSFQEIEINDIREILKILTNNGSVSRGSSWTKDGHYVRKNF